MNTRLITPSAMTTVALMSAAMCAAGFLALPAPALPHQGYGLLFPVPEAWPVAPLWGEVANAAVIGLSAPAVFLINKHFSLLKSSLPFWALFYLPLTCSVLTVSGHLTGNILLLPAVLMILVALFGGYRSRNATRATFFIATCISVGAMVQPAFIPFILPVLGGMALMKICHFREITALLLGLIAPYWVLLGLGIVSIDDFHLPQLSDIFTSPIPEGCMPMVIGTAVAFAISLLLSLYNGIKLYAGNSRIRALNNVVNLFGITAVVAMTVDMANMASYVGVVNLWFALQFANLFTLWNLHKPIWIFWLIQLCIFSYSVILILTMH